MNALWNDDKDNDLQGERLVIFVAKILFYRIFHLVYVLYTTLESGINIRVRLLIFEVFSRGYILIKGGYVYWFLILKIF